MSLTFQQQSLRGLRASWSPHPSGRMYLKPFHCADLEDFSTSRSSCTHTRRHAFQNSRGDTQLDFHVRRPVSQRCAHPTHRPCLAALPSRSVSSHLIYKVSPGASGQAGRFSIFAWRSGGRKPDRPRQAHGTATNALGETVYLACDE